MKKKIFALVLALALVFTVSNAFASSSIIEELEYKGFGILKLEFRKDLNWYPDAVFTLTDAEGLVVTITPFAGEDEDAYLYAPEIIDGAAYTLAFTLDSNNQSIPFTAETGIKLKINKDGAMRTEPEDDRCDFCGERSHDEDFCPKRVNPGDIPADLDGLAWYFDIDEFCDRCGSFGHDDDHCRG